MPKTNFESEFLILNIDPKSTSKEFENNNETLRYFISLHKRYNEIKHSCKDNEFVQFHNELTSNGANKRLFYTGLEPKIQEKYAKPGKVKKYIDTIQQMYANAIVNYMIIKTKIPCDKHKDKKRLVSVLFHVTLNNGAPNNNLSNNAEKHLHILIPLDYGDFHD